MPHLSSDLACSAVLSLSFPHIPQVCFDLALCGKSWVHVKNAIFVRLFRVRGRSCWRVYEWKDHRKDAVAELNRSSCRLRTFRGEKEMRLQLTGRGWEKELEDCEDCIVVGGGPAGLTAAIYLSRFLRRCTVIDAGPGRAASIPKTRNLPGFPDGISGVDFLLRMKVQAQQYGAQFRSGRVDSLMPCDEGFTLSSAGETLRAQTVLLATGVHNCRPDISVQKHDDALARGLIRYCPVCDGFEASGACLAVLGCDTHGAREAEFLRRYSSRVTLLAQNSFSLSPSDYGRLMRHGITIASAPVSYLNIDADRVVAELNNGEKLNFDILYPALGTKPQSSLAANAGVQLSASGGILTDTYMQTSVPGLFAAGDVVEGLDQISVANGQAAKAATAIHNLLREREEAAAISLGTMPIESSLSRNGENTD